MKARLYPKIPIKKDGGSIRSIDWSRRFVPNLTNNGKPNQISYKLYFLLPIAFTRIIRYNILLKLSALFFITNNKIVAFF